VTKVALSDRDVWLVAYDIRCPRRLRRVHRTLKAEGLALQYSVFCFEGSSLGLERIMDALELVIDSSVDDVRAYRLPAVVKTWMLGRQEWPDGVYLEGSEAIRALAAALPGSESREGERLGDSISI